MYHPPQHYRITMDTMKTLTKIHPHLRTMVSAWVQDPEEIGYDQGTFFLPRPSTMKGMFFLVRASTEGGWEHLSVSIPTENRCPTWEEMCFIKDQFWSDDEVVVQYHPSRKDYVNLAPYCLHLWKPTNQKIITPPSIMVGI